MSAATTITTTSFTSPPSNNSQSATTGGAVADWPSVAARLPKARPHCGLVGFGLCGATGRSPAEGCPPSTARCNWWNATHGYLGDLESGRAKPSLELALTIADFFGVLVDLLARDETALPEE